jgi:outer membrane protein OmpA-like peptidoglycan-associated protein
MRAGKEWMSIADMMAGLMMVFMFIAVVFMITMERENKAIRDIALTYENSKSALRAQLEAEFESDLDRWGAEILEDGTVRFKEPDVLFARSSAAMKPQFLAILDDFFPRYVTVLSSGQFRNEIDELRIEGHTSSIWRRQSTPEEAYLENARLSQARSLSVLGYVYLLPGVEEERDWLTTVVRANGVSFARRLYDENGVEDLARSRRVEFRVVTKAEEKIYTILEASRGF